MPEWSSERGLTLRKLIILIATWLLFWIGIGLSINSSEAGVYVALAGFVLGLLVVMFLR
jgi:hypothetical protein